jgi:hypothetical protein
MMDRDQYNAFKTCMEIYRLFSVAHGGRYGRDREMRQWANSEDGQATLTEHGIDWEFKSEAEIAEYEAAQDIADEEHERTDPRRVMINALIGIIEASSKEQRKVLARAIDGWKQSIGGDYLAWGANDRKFDNAAEMWLEMFVGVQDACRPAVTDLAAYGKKFNPFRLVDRGPPDGGQT